MNCVWFLSTNSLLEKVEQETWRETGISFVTSVTRLMERLLDYRYFLRHLPDLFQDTLSFKGISLTLKLRPCALHGEDCSGIGWHHLSLGIYWWLGTEPSLTSRQNFLKSPSNASKRYPRDLKSSGLPFRNVKAQMSRHSKEEEKSYLQRKAENRCNSLVQTFLRSICHLVPMYNPGGLWVAFPRTGDLPFSCLHSLLKVSLFISPRS